MVVEVTINYMKKRVNTWWSRSLNLNRMGIYFMHKILAKELLVLVNWINQPCSTVHISVSTCCFNFVLKLDIVWYLSFPQKTVINIMSSVLCRRSLIQLLWCSYFTSETPFAIIVLHTLPYNISALLSFLHLFHISSRLLGVTRRRRGQPPLWCRYTPQGIFSCIFFKEKTLHFTKRCYRRAHYVIITFKVYWYS